MDKMLKSKLNKLYKTLKKRLSFFVSSSLAIAITSFVLVGSVSAAIVTYQAMNTPQEKQVKTQIETNKEPPVVVTEKITKDEEPAASTVDTNHQDLAPEQYTNASVSRDTRYYNVHDISQSALPTCSDGWQYIASNGDFTCMQNGCNYAYLSRVKDGVDETTIGLSRGVRGGVGCSYQATAADIWSMNNSICQDGTQNCVTSTIVDVKRNPNYTATNGQE